MRSFMNRIVTARIGGTTNFYRDGAGAALRRSRLEAYLDSRTTATWLLVGEAPGYRGARISGLPFTSERQLTGSGPGESTATIVHRVLAELGLTHPGTMTSNRRPTRSEIEAGRAFAVELARGRRVVCAGRIAHAALGGVYVRHPSHGGSTAFAEMLHAAVAS